MGQVGELRLVVRAVAHVSLSQKKAVNTMPRVASRRFNATWLSAFLFFYDAVIMVPGKSSGWRRRAGNSRKGIVFY
jgi:hypothetical protein